MNWVCNLRGHDWTTYHVAWTTNGNETQVLLNDMCRRCGIARNPHIFEMQNVISKSPAAVSNVQRIEDEDDDRPMMPIPRTRP